MYVATSVGDLFARLYEPCKALAFTITGDTNKRFGNDRELSHVRDADPASPAPSTLRSAPSARTNTLRSRDRSYYLAHNCSILPDEEEVTDDRKLEGLPHTDAGHGHISVGVIATTFPLERV